MDPLSILSIVAATLQFVDFGQRLFSETWHIYHSASGQSLELEELSIVSADISRLSSAVQDTLKVQQRNGSISEEADTQLLRLCNECEAISSQIQRILPKVSTGFQLELNQDKRAIDQAKFQGFEPRSVGQCFRAALNGSWQRKDIEQIRSRLDKVRQGTMMAATISIWRNTQSTKNWEQHFSNKLDTLIAMLSQALETGGYCGPEQGHIRHSIEKTTTDSMLQNSVMDQVKERLWNQNWKPDMALLSCFPEQTAFSIQQLNSFISDSLRFDSMDNREETIAKTFDCTYQWVFDRVPQTTTEGLPMWSSLPDWLESNQGLPYWITGKPGSGKSTMMKYIMKNPELYEHLQRWSKDSPVHTISYYAWKPGVELGRSVDGLLRTLLHRVLVANADLTPFLCPRRWSLFHAIRELDPGIFPPWTTWELEESFAHLLAYTKDNIRVMLFIDGLDEFDTAPAELCNRIQGIASHNMIKVCVASRPWPQFSDAFAKCPGLQMHLLTGTDIQAFVHGHFQGVVAFQELNDLYQSGGDQILSEMTKKAKGVFLWTALVTQTLLQALVEGSSLLQLQEMLDKMPSEIENLYDAIYSTIPARLLPEVSAMLQLFVLAVQPLDWKSLWLADEARNGPTAISIQTLDLNMAQTSLKRRLSARTRGILELVPQTQTVEYLHRTAAEWVNQPRVWEQLRSSSPRGFDPHFCHLHAETVAAENLPQSGFWTPMDVAFWKQVVRTLHYASLIDQSIISDAAITAIIDRYYDASSRLFGRFLRGDATWKLPWPSYQCRRVVHVKANSFDALAVQFSVLPYIRCKFEESSHDFHNVPKKELVPLLEQAIFGPGRYSATGLLKILDQPNLPQVAFSQRRDVVAYLLERGIRQPGIVSLIKEAELSLKSEANMGEDETSHITQYYNEVMQLLTCYQAVNRKRGYIRRLFKLK